MLYPVSESLRKAIESVFDDSSIGLETIGARKILPPDWYMEGESISIPIVQRVKMLRNYLENRISQMANEKEEYDCPEETERLRAETIAMLIALREIFLHIPEAYED